MQAVAARPLHAGRPGTSDPAALPGVVSGATLLAAGLARPPDVHDLDGEVPSRAKHLVRHGGPVQQAGPARAAGRPDHQLAGAGLVCGPDQSRSGVAGPDLGQSPVQVAKQPTVLLQPRSGWLVEVVDGPDVHSQGQSPGRCVACPGRHAAPSRQVQKPERPDPAGPPDRAGRRWSSLDPFGHACALSERGRCGPWPGRAATLATGEQPDQCPCSSGPAGDGANPDAIRQRRHMPAVPGEPPGTARAQNSRSALRGAERDRSPSEAVQHSPSATCYFVEETAKMDSGRLMICTLPHRAGRRHLAAYRGRPPRSPSR